MSSSLSSLLYTPQRFVDRIAMYRIVSGSLGVLAVCSIVSGFLGWLPYSGLSQLFTLSLAIGVALLLNLIVAAASRIPANHESAIITALILFFLVEPAATLMGNWPLLAAIVVAIMSKYTIVYRKQHLPNPAALGAVALSLPGFYVFSWWVANPTLVVPLVILGLLIVMKVRKWAMVLSFIGVGLVVYLFEAYRYGEVLSDATQLFFVSWPTLFLAFFMLTEPFTMPPTKKTQVAYGATVGFLANTALFASFVSVTPELALVVANLVYAPLRLNQKLYLYLEAKRQIAKDTYEYVFAKPPRFTFTAGQYLEWMLPHKGADGRGIRRYFTIASSPTESVVRVAMKKVPGGSSYKEALHTLDENGVVIASQLAGDFVLPKDENKKVGFIAGGIGITPFRSQVKYMIDSNKSHDTTLYYCVNTQDELAYRDVFADAARTFAFTLIPVVAKEAVQSPLETGYVTADMITRRTPDFKERTWYISGPPGMVNTYKALLKDMGVKGSQIKTDFFPGLA